LLVSGEYHPNAKLTETSVKEIFTLRTSRDNARRVAQNYGVGRSNILSIWNRTSWRRVTLPLLTPEQILIPSNSAISVRVADSGIEVRWNVFHIARQSDPELTVCGNALRPYVMLHPSRQRIMSVLDAPASERCTYCYNPVHQARYSLTELSIEYQTKRVKYVPIRR
jgi:hypothetical protein